MSDINLAQTPSPGAAPGGAPKPAIPGGLPKSPIGGPSGPGASPMMSPGGGAGMQARAKARLGGLLKNLTEMAGDFVTNKTAFDKLSHALRLIGQVVHEEAAVEAPKAPVPVAPTPPGTGIGARPGAPPTTLPPTGGAPGMMGPSGG